ncbi:MAG: UDP-glucose 4-epimerase GalE, partial [Ruminococcaceae bacterium]|nr:UDP-glucose 4-epimerase GalE [Oscillospiraceae bacterium]
TGGAGFIGSHTAVELIEQGHEVVIIDNFANSKPEAVRRIAAITGKTIPLYTADVADKTALSAIFEEHKIDAVIHFAGLKAVGESVRLPLLYYRNNLDTTFTLLETMKAYGCRRIIFSSSATVYGDPATVPITEDMPTGQCSNPYGKTKYMIEQILTDVAHAEPDLTVVLLRYFNPIGAHKSGLLVEDPNGIPNNLMPYILKVASGKLQQLNVFGNDYPTPDGTGVRDYIHVTDLARGHVAALNFAAVNTGVEVFNLGTGNGYSVLDVVKAFNRSSGLTIPYRIAARREGDIATCYASPDKARNGLGWEAEYSLDDMCRDAWNAVQKNPDGYPED